MTITPMRFSSLVLGAACIAALALPQRVAAQATETAVPVGASPVGVGPNGATLRCRDGFYPAPGAPDSACQDRGGVLARFPLRRTPTRAAAAQASAARAAQNRETERRNAATAAARADSARAANTDSYSARRARADSLNRAANTPPAGATLLCGDGTWVVRDTTRSRCASHGGVRAIVPPRP